MKRWYLLFSVIFITSLSFSREGGETSIRSVEVVLDESLARRHELPYTSIPMTWEDFEAAPDTFVAWGAMTHSGIRLRYEYRENKDSMTALVRLLPFMDRDRSWCKEFAKNDYTLRHEQGHFDITYLTTRALEAEIRSTNFHLVDFATTIMKLHSKYLKLLEKRQKEYDNATAHGDNYAGQMEWNTRVDDWLQEDAMTSVWGERGAPRVLNSFARRKTN